MYTESNGNDLQALCRLINSFVSIIHALAHTHIQIKQSHSHQFQWQPLTAH